MANAFVLHAGDRYRKEKEEGRPPEELQILKDVANKLYILVKLRYQRAPSVDARLNYLDEQMNSHAFIFMHALTATLSKMQANKEETDVALASQLASSRCSISDCVLTYMIRVLIMPRTRQYCVEASLMQLG